MKKFIALCLSVLLLLSIFTACSGDSESEKEYDVKAIVDTIVEANPLSSEGGAQVFEIDEEYLDYMKITDYCEEYAGYYTNTNPGFDIVCAVKAKPENLEDVQSAFEEVINTAGRNADLYPNEATKAANGRIVVKGNYVVLAIAGDVNVLKDEGVDKMYEPVDRAIEEAFK